MKIYIASSWKNQHAVELLVDILEKEGNTVISFVRKADKDESRINWKRAEETFEKWVTSEKAHEKFVFDTQGASQSDLVIYVGPSGVDAWAEIGVAWQSGKKILGLWAKGEQIGLMRYMISEWFSDYRELLKAISNIKY